MKKFIYISSLLLFISISVNAQLTMNWNKKFSIGPETEDFVPLLMVNNDWFFIEGEDTCSIGTGGAPYALNGKNIGVFGSFWANPNYSQDSNFGVLGIVESNANHGRNYGLCGMIDPSTSSGGAGIYGVDCDYCYTFPYNLRGNAYAALFVGGHVHVSGNLTINNMFSLSDKRLCDNIVSLSQSKRSGTTTLENLLNMNIVEYNLKGRQFEEVSEDVAPEKAEKLKRELEFLKKEEQEKASRRHYGVDARELQKVYPDLVLEGQDGYLSVNYLEMVPLVIRSIQELKQEIDELSE
jgi:hypothetical protein